MEQIMNARRIRLMAISLMALLLLAPVGGGAATVGKGGNGAEYFAAFLRSAVEERLTEKFSAPGRTIEKMTVLIPKSYRPPEEFDDLKITVPYQNRSGKRVFVTVSILQGGEVISRINVMAEVALSMEMVVATRDIKRNEHIGADAVALGRKNVGPGFRHVATRIDQVVGKQMDRAIRQGAPLRIDQVKTPLMVTSGDMVTVVAQNGRMRITTLAKAKESGNTGDWIRIQNIDSKKQFSARITGPGLVSVLF